METKGPLISWQNNRLDRRSSRICVILPINPRRDFIDLCYRLCRLMRLMFLCGGTHGTTLPVKRQILSSLMTTTACVQESKVGRLVMV